MSIRDGGVNFPIYATVNKFPNNDNHKGPNIPHNEGRSHSSQARGVEHKPGNIPPRSLRDSPPPLPKFIPGKSNVIEGEDSQGVNKASLFLKAIRERCATLLDCCKGIGRSGPVPKDVPDNAPNDAPNDVSNDVSNDAPDNTSNNVPKDVPNNPPNPGKNREWFSSMNINMVAVRRAFSRLSQLFRVKKSTGTRTNKTTRSPIIVKAYGQIRISPITTLKYSFSRVKKQTEVKVLVGPNEYKVRYNMRTHAGEVYKIINKSEERCDIFHPNTSYIVKALVESASSLHPYTYKEALRTALNNQYKALLDKEEGSIPKTYLELQDKQKIGAESREYTEVAQFPVYSTGQRMVRYPVSEEDFGSDTDSFSEESIEDDRGSDNSSIRTSVSEDIHPELLQQEPVSIPQGAPSLPPAPPPQDTKPNKGKAPVEEGNNGVVDVPQGTGEGENNAGNIPSLPPAPPPQDTKPNKGKAPVEEGNNGVVDVPQGIGEGENNAGNIPSLPPAPPPQNTKPNKGKAPVEEGNNGVVDVPQGTGEGENNAGNIPSLPPAPPPQNTKPNKGKAPVEEGNNGVVDVPQGTGEGENNTGNIPSLPSAQPLGGSTPEGIEPSSVSSSFFSRVRKAIDRTLYRVRNKSKNSVSSSKKDLKANIPLTKEGVSVQSIIIPEAMKNNFVEHHDNVESAKDNVKPLKPFQIAEKNQGKDFSLPSKVVDSIKDTPQGTEEGEENTGNIPSLPSAPPMNFRERVASLFDFRPKAQESTVPVVENRPVSKEEKQYRLLEANAMTVINQSVKDFNGMQEDKKPIMSIWEKVQDFFREKGKGIYPMKKAGDKIEEQDVNLVVNPQKEPTTGIPVLQSVAGIGEPLSSVQDSLYNGSIDTEWDDDSDTED